jgi:hypothetical protein
MSKSDRWRQRQPPFQLQNHRDTVLAILSLRGPIAAMMKATGWQQHSVRGFLAGVVRKRLKLKLGSKKVDGNRVYQIASADSGKPTSRHPQCRPA